MTRTRPLGGAGRLARAFARFQRRDVRNASRCLASGNQYRTTRPGKLVVRVTPDQKSRFANAMNAKPLLGDVDHRVAVGLFHELAPVFLAREQKKVAIVEDAPPRITGQSLAPFDLTHRTQPVVRGNVPLGLGAEEIASFRRGKTIRSALVLDRVVVLTDDQPAIANQADTCNSRRARAALLP